MLISVHIPKTAGSTLRAFLGRQFRDRLLFDYADFPMRQTAAQRNAAALSARDALDVPGLRSRYDCVHGHFLPVKYARVDGAFRTIWLRDPVTLVASRYSYHRRKNAEAAASGDEVPMPHLEPSLNAHALNRHYQNLYAQYLYGTDLSAFDFVGITERFDRSFRVFCGLQGFDFGSSDLAPVNVNPERAATGYDLDEETARVIREANALDIGIYERALRINDRLLAQHGA
jgi:hypothetical protein